MEYLQKLYENPNFGIYLMVIIGVLLLLFFIFLVLAIKDAKKNKLAMEESKPIDEINNEENKVVEFNTTNDVAFKEETVPEAVEFNNVESVVEPSVSHEVNMATEFRLNDRVAEQVADVASVNSVDDTVINFGSQTVDEGITTEPIIEPEIQVEPIIQPEVQPEPIIQPEIQSEPVLQPEPEISFNFDSMNEEVSTPVIEPTAEVNFNEFNTPEVVDQPVTSEYNEVPATSFENNSQVNVTNDDDIKRFEDRLKEIEGFSANETKPLKTQQFSSVYVENDKPKNDIEIPLPKVNFNSFNEKETKVESQEFDLPKKRDIPLPKTIDVDLGGTNLDDLVNEAYK